MNRNQPDLALTTKHLLPRQATSFHLLSLDNNGHNWCIVAFLHKENSVLLSKWGRGKGSLLNLKLVPHVTVYSMTHYAAVRQNYHCFAHTCTLSAKQTAANTPLTSNRIARCYLRKIGACCSALSSFLGVDNLIKAALARACWAGSSLAVDNGARVLQLNAVAILTP